MNSKAVYEMVVNQIVAVGKPRSAVKMAAYLKDLHNNLGKYRKQIDKLLQVDVYQENAIAEILFDVHNCMLDISENIKSVRSALRRVINYCCCNGYKECDEVRVMRIQRFVEDINLYTGYLELHKIVDAKTDDEILEYIKNRSKDILENVESGNSDRVRKNVRLAWDISRIMACAKEAGNDELKIKITRSLWGNWAIPLADTYTMKEELDELLDRLRNAEVDNRLAIGEILVDIDILLENLKDEVKEVKKMFGDRVMADVPEEN